MAMEELISACTQCLEQVTAKGETVVHLAVKANQFGAMKMLADSIKRHNLQTVFKAQDQKGRSAYQLAAAKKHFQVLELLKEDDEGDEIRVERRINEEEEEGSDDSEASKNEESNEWQSQQDAILVLATLIITLTYQAMANPPSTFVKDGSSTIVWGFPRPDQNHQRSQGGAISLKDPHSCVLALLFMILNRCIFLLSIYVVATTLWGPRVFPVRPLTLFLMMCCSILVTAFCYNAVYSGMPYAILGIAQFASYILVKQNFLTGWMPRRRRHQQPEGS